MKLFPVVFLALAAGVLAWVAMRAPERTYVPPKPALASGPSIPRTLPAEVPAGLERVVLRVEGMCCNGCTEKLYTRLSGVHGVERVAVRFEDGRAEAFVREGIEADVLAVALTFDEYVAVEAGR